MAVYVWYGGGGNLDDPNLWSQPDPSNPSVPGAGGAADKAIISGAGTLAGSLYASILDLSGDFTLEGNISSDAILPFTGKLNIGSGGSLSGHFVNGYLQDDGTVDVSGTGSLFANTDIGYSGNGTITVENGGTVKADYFNVGVGSTGIATITGVGSSLSTADGGQYQNIEVGQNGTGTLIIADQALVATVGLEVAVNNAGAGVTDDLEVHGANLTVFQTLIVGMGGSANATFDVGANVGAQNIIVADLPDSTGEMDIRASATVSAGSLDVGAGASTNGTVVVDNSQLNITGNATIGDSGIGTLAVLNGGLVKVGGALTINSSSKVTIDGGTLELGTAVGSGPILFGPNVKDSSGHYPMLQIDSSFMPTNVISEFATGDEIDLTKLPLAALTSSGTVSEKPSAAPLTQVQIAANGTTDSLNLSESSAYDLAFKADGGSGSEFTVTKADATDATNEAGIVLDATKNFFKAVVALKSYRGLSVDEFNKVFGPVFAAVGAGTEANTIYQHLNAVLSSPNSTSAQIAAAWQTAVTDTVDVAVKFALATVIEEGTGAFAQAFLEAIAAFAPAGTVSEFFAVLATGGLVLEAPVIIGVGAVVGVSALLASPAFSSWYNTNIKERVGGWVASTLNPLVGVTLHGYISGATVFADANGNGQLDPGEVSTTTDANGNFILFGGTGPLVAFGGTDTSTGLPFKGVLEAPAGSSVIDPLTTMLSGIVSNTGLSEAAAQQKLLSGLGLPSNINLTTFDPIATAKGGDAAGAGAYVALAKVYDTVDIIATALSGVGVNFSKAYADTFAALDNAITALPAGQTLDLADQATIASLISSVSHTENVNLTSAATVASAIVASNIGLDQALARDGASPTLLADVANDQKMVLAPQPTVVPFAPTVVEKSQTTVIATVAPGAPGDTLTLTETAGVGTLSLGPLQSDGTEQVIYTAPASISQSAVDAVTYTVNESDGAHATVSANVQLNAGPTIIAATVSGTEGVAISGATVATFTDANPNATASDFTATIDWGDGTSTTGTVVARSGGGFAVDGTHTYADEGKYNIGVSIKDEGGSTASATSTATVADADLLTSHGIRLRGHVGQTLTNVVVATFKDAYTGNIASDFTATINWGDGVKTAGVVTDLAGNITVSGTHTFETSGRDTVTVTLRDDSPDSATATATSKVAIPSVKLRIKPGDGDNIINYAEAHSIHGVLITGREKGLVAGESFNVTVTDKNFSKTYTAVVGEKGSWTATIPIVDALKLADGTATITAQVGNVMAFGKVTVAETLPTVTINKVNGSDVIVNQAANCGGAGNHEDGGRDQLSVGCNNGLMIMAISMTTSRTEMR